MQGFVKHIEFFGEEKYRQLAYGTILYVAGTKSSEINSYVRSHADDIAERLNDDEQNWVTCKIEYLTAKNPLFPTLENAAFYSAMLPIDNLSNMNMFLVAELQNCEPQLMEDAFTAYFCTLQQMFDEILDTGNYSEELLQPEILSFQTLCMEMDMGAAEFEEPPAPCAPCGSARFSVSSPRLLKAGACLRKREVLSVEPARLVITPGAHQVLIPDYDIEIHFTPQVKALYILFLNHPAGIRMSEIEDYKEEFKHIFFRVTDRTDEDWIRQSVERLIDVCNPQALNVKKSQCAEQLKKAIPNADLRRYYEIEVHRGQPHTINLDRSLVSMPEDLYV